MKRYYYHGFEPYCYYGNAVEHMLSIINSGGIKKRNEISGKIENLKLNHICLYRKNENYDYNSENAFLESARGGWIDRCMVFIISPDIEAKYMPPNMEIAGCGLTTNLVDEWRCFENIPLDKIVGIALPLDSIKEYLDEKPFFEEEENDKLKLKESLKKLNNICKKLGFIVANSEIKNFTDKLDFELQSQITNDDLTEDLII